jgi:serine/threonine protein kinase
MRSAATSHLTPGTRIGRYCIDELIARGGMGEVWLATAHGVGGFAKKVVLKTILPQLAQDDAYVRMLINEASISARLNHPNIVQVFDLEYIEGHYFIAMEYLPGRTLNQLMKQLDGNEERAAPWLAATVAASCCDGLQYAHDYRDEQEQSLGLLHRDISPSNIMLTFAGGVTILDFGIAKTSTSEQLTAHGGVKGKFHYMPPERIRGLPGDRRSDVYSLGVVLYQMLAWRRPFHADNDGALIERILRAEPAPIARSAPWLNPRLEVIVLKAMAKRPADRYQEAAHLASDLRGYLRDSGEARAPAELADYVRNVFADAPEVRNLLRCERAVDPGIASAVGPSNDSDTFEILEIIIGSGEDDSVLEDEAPPAPELFPEPHPVRSQAPMASGSSEPSSMPDEPVSVYDLALSRRTRPEQQTDVADLFGAPLRRKRDEPGIDLFGIRHLEPEPPRPRHDGSGRAPFVADPEPHEPGWPWAPLPKKSR